MTFRLPPEIATTKERIEDQWVYTFRHKDFGDIGRIRLKGTGNNTMINLDVTGDPDDPMTAKRREIFEPIGMRIANQMESIVGKGTEKLPPTPMPTTDKNIVESKIMRCETCGAPVAMLIFAGNTQTLDSLEDYARLMYQKYSKMNLPTWVIGDLAEDTPDATAYILKVWPERESVRCLSPNEFNPELFKLQESHCHDS